MFLIFLFPLFTFAQTEAPIVIEAPSEPSLSSPYTIPGSTWELRGGEPGPALRQVPGLLLATNGGAGQTKSVFIRGARAEDTLVLLDGMPLNDPLSPSRAFDFSEIPLGTVERVEVLKGPQSVLYGSDAMGGVVQLFSKREPESKLRAEGGSYRKIKAQASHLGFQSSYEQSRGFSAADSREGNAERDGHRAWRLGGNKIFSLADNASLRVQAFYHNAVTDTDRSGGVGGDSINTYNRSSQLLFRMEAIRIAENGLEWTTSASLNSRAREDNTVGPAFYRSNLVRAESKLHRRWRAHSPTVGVVFEREAGRSSEITATKKFNSGGVYAQETFSSGRWQAEAGARLDLHSSHTSAKNFRAGIGYWLAPERAKLKASAGTGFKAPTLYQTYSSYGNSALRPSKSVGFDGGGEFAFGPWAAELVYYENHFRELIDFDLTRMRYFNVGRARTRGVEGALSWQRGLFTVKNSLTILRAKDLSTGEKLLRRPTFTDVLEFTVARTRWGLSTYGRYVGKREDVHPVAYSRQTMPAFFLVDMDFFRTLSEGWKIVGRGENLLNRKYQEVSGYGTAGLSIYGGVEAVF